MDWSVTERDGRAEIYVNHPKDDKGSYRAWAVGPRGRCLLGSLIPQGDRLILRKTLRRAALEQTGCWPVTAVECQPAALVAPGAAPAGWTAIPAELDWPDGVIRQAVQTAKGGLYRPTEQGFALAYPLDCRCPFPLPPLFCFARLQCLVGHPWWVFPFDANCAPRLEDA